MGGCLREVSSLRTGSMRDLGSWLAHGADWRLSRELYCQRNYKSHQFEKVCTCLRLKASGGPSCYLQTAVWSLHTSRGMAQSWLYTMQEGTVAQNLPEGKLSARKDNRHTSSIFPRSTVPWPPQLAMPLHVIAGHSYSLQERPQGSDYCWMTSQCTRVHISLGLFCWM